MRKHASSHGGRHVQPLEPRYLFAAGDVDTTFANNGRTDNVLPGDVSFLTRTIVLPDGKILFGGSSIHALLAPQDQYFLRRFNADGSVDNTFGNGGTAMGNFTSDPTDDSRLDSMTIGPDGKIWGVGRSEVAEGPGGGFFLARFNANGSPDTTFGGGDGDVAIAAAAFDLQVQSDGKPVLIAHDFVSRYLANGSPDTTFGGGDGVAESPMSGNGASTSVLRLQSDNKLLLGGFVTESDVLRFAVARLNTNGTPDTSFSSDGLATTAVTGSGTLSNSVDDIVQLANGQLLVAGSTLGNGMGGFELVRYNANGTEDGSFGTGGGMVVPLGGSTRVQQLLIDASGNAVVLGEAGKGLAIARVTPAGTLDQTFGRVITFGSGFADVASAGLLGSTARATGAGFDANGKLVVAGQQRLITTDEQEHHLSFLIRYLTTDNGVPSPVTLDTAAHVMSVAGTSDADLMEAAQFGNVVFAHRAGYGRAFDAADVQHVAITGGDGNDQISTADLVTVPASVIGGLGADKIAGGAAGDTIDGSGGNDSIDGNGGPDLLIGSNGNDALRGFGGDDTLAGGAGDDDLRGGAGVDTYDGGPGKDVEVDLDIADITFVDGLLKFFDADNSDDQVAIIPDGTGRLFIFVNGATNMIDENLVQRIELNGNGGDDFLRVYQGLAIPALMYGGEGGETSRGGNDTLIGGGGNDTLFGNDGDDVIFGNGGNDYLNGFVGSDLMHGNAGRDTVDYSQNDGRTFITLDNVQDDGFIGENDLAFSDIEKVIGGSGPDRISGSSGDNILYGGGGDDTLGGGGGNDALYGAEGNDKLDGGDGDDYLEAGAGHDVLAGGAGADQLFALAGNDTLLSDDGVRDTVRGGTGADTADADDLDDVLSVESFA